MNSLLFLAMLCGAVAQKPHSGDYPPRFFTSRQEAITSTEKAFAGGSSQELKVGKKNVLILYHYASGAFSTDAAIYLEGTNEWTLLAYYAPLLNDSIEASVDGRTVVLKAYHHKQVLLTVSVDPRR